MTFWTASPEIFWNIGETSELPQRGRKETGMKIIGAVLGIFYAGLMLFAVCREKSKSVSSVLIAAGSLLVLLYAVWNLIRGQNFILVMIIGMLCISAGALINGFRQKNLHVSHHVIRFAAETFITVICWLGK